MLNGQEKEFSVAEAIQNIQEVNSDKYKHFKDYALGLPRYCLTHLKDSEKRVWLFEQIKALENKYRLDHFEFNFDCDGEFVIVNDELDAYTYREEFTDNYISVRENIQNTQFEVGIKNVLFDYSSASEGDFQEDTDLNKNDQLIKVLSVVLVILVVVYILLRIIFSIMNKKVK